MSGSNRHGWAAIRRDSPNSGDVLARHRCRLGTPPAASDRSQCRGMGRRGAAVGHVPLQHHRSGTGDRRVAAQATGRQAKQAHPAMDRGPPIAGLYRAYPRGRRHGCAAMCGAPCSRSEALQGFVDRRDRVGPWPHRRDPKPGRPRTNGSSRAEPLGKTSATRRRRRPVHRHRLAEAHWIGTA